MSEDTPAPDPDLTVVATAGGEPEAEIIVQRLRAAGIVALAQRTIGSVEWGASGSRYIYVRAADAERARELLAGEGASSGEA